MADGSESEDMVGTAGNLSDLHFRESGEGDGGVLEFRMARHTIETKDTFIGLIPS